LKINFSITNWVILSNQFPQIGNFINLCFISMMTSLSTTNQTLNHNPSSGTYRLALVFL